jgi:hypothetical protein
MIMGDNPVWAGINGGQDIQTALIGPEYSYSDHVAQPSSLGVGTNGTFGQIMTNLNAGTTYVSTLISGNPTLGNRFFVNTAAQCTAPDGSTQSRFNYINNIASASKLLPSGVQAIGGGLTGLIPGAVGDIASLNPTYLFRSLSSDGLPSCECYKCVVTSGSEYQFLTPALSPDFSSTLCERVDSSMCLNDETKETFTNFASSESAPHVLIAIGVFLALMMLSGKK